MRLTDISVQQKLVSASLPLVRSPFVYKCARGYTVWKSILLKCALTCFFLIWIDSCLKVLVEKERIKYWIPQWYNFNMRFPELWFQLLTLNIFLLYWKECTAIDYMSYCFLQSVASSAFIRCYSGIFYGIFFYNLKWQYLGRVLPSLSLWMKISYFVRFCHSPAYDFACNAMSLCAFILW